MTTRATSGIPVTLVAQFQANGVLADPEEPLVLSVTRISDSEVLFTNTDDFEHVSEGIFAFEWTPISVDARTDFTVTWDPAGDDVPATEILEVYPATSGTWATLEDVADITRKSVTEDNLVIASNMISAFTGADIDAPTDAITLRDRGYLKKATAWQAAWLPSKAGILTDRESARRMSSDTQSVERADRADNMLAPMARFEIMNLSWIGTRSTWVPPRSLTKDRANFLNEESDVYGRWDPLS